MKRFEFVTGTYPEEKGEGVQFEDGKIVYREWVATAWGTTIEGTVSDIEKMYGGQAGYKFKWLD
jgi:hypothetical protein